MDTSTLEFILVGWQEDANLSGLFSPLCSSEQQPPGVLPMPSVLETPAW